MADACVIGSPVSHSLSPRLQGYWLRQYGIDAAYTARDVAAENLAEFMKSLQRPHWVGCNVTVPHKQSVMAYMDSVSDEAKAIGAVNTVVVMPDNRKHGLNTDSYGFCKNLEQASPRLAKRKAVVLGAGGAARAVLKGLADMGFAHIVVVNRTQAKGEELAAAFGKSVETAPWESRHAALENASLLVNSTSLGLRGGNALEIELSLLPPDATVCDIVYNPLETPLLAQARRRGNGVVDGLGMLLHQAVPAFHAWFGIMPEVTDELRRYMMEAYAA